jgi:hypothetical protein
VVANATKSRLTYAASDHLRAFGLDEVAISRRMDWT